MPDRPLIGRLGIAIAPTIAIAFLSSVVSMYVSLQLTQTQLASVERSNKDMLDELKLLRAGYNKTDASVSIIQNTLAGGIQAAMDEMRRRVVVLEEAQRDSARLITNFQIEFYTLKGAAPARTPPGK